MATKQFCVLHVFCMADDHKDINILNHSPVFDQLIQGKTLATNNSVNDHTYMMCYHLTNSTYPEYATLIRTVAHPTMPMKRLFGLKQEATHKNVERSIRVLQIRWSITQGPVCC